MSDPSPRHRATGRGSLPDRKLTTGCDLSSSSKHGLAVHGCPIHVDRESSMTCPERRRLMSVFALANEAWTKLRILTDWPPCFLPDASNSCQQTHRSRYT